MKFKHGTRRRAAEYEKDWVQRWKEDDTFNKSIAQRPADNSWVFYDGPPFLTGTPHHGHLLVSTVKDTRNLNSRVLNWKRLISWL